VVSNLCRFSKMGVPEMDKALGKFTEYYCGLTTIKKVIFTALAVYFVFCSLFFEPYARSMIFEHFKIVRLNGCQPTDYKRGELFCAERAKQNVACENRSAGNPFYWWWLNKGERRLSQKLNEKFQALGQDFPKFVEWMACQGFAINKSTTTINIGSPLIFGYGLFANNLIGLGYASSLRIENIESGKLKVRVGFSYL
jgi:hypothetical protein